MQIDSCEMWCTDCGVRLRGDEIKTIARRLEGQWPELGALTLSGEIQDLPEKLAEMGVEVGIVESNLPPSAPFSTFGPGAVGFARAKA